MAAVHHPSGPFIPEDLSVAGRCGPAGLCGVFRRDRGPRRFRLLGNDQRRPPGLCLRAVDGLLGRTAHSRDRCGSGYVLLRRAEENDSLEERAPPRATNAAMFDAREPARLRAEPHDIGHATQAGRHTLVHVASCVLGRRRSSRRTTTAPDFSGASARSISRAGSRCLAIPISCSFRITTPVGKAIWRTSSRAPMTV